MSSSENHSAARDALRRAAESKDADAMVAAMAEDVTFFSPVVFKSYSGRDDVLELLTIVVQTFEDFEYTDELDGEDSAALVFTARVGDKKVHGLDLVRGDAQGRIAELMVMIRPLSGAIALAQTVGPQLEAAGSLAE
jgi:hypothetical protein